MEVCYEKSSACFLSVWSTDMGARLFSGGDNMVAEVGLGGAVVMLSFTPKSQVTGDPGLERILAETCWMTSLCLVGLSGGLDVIRIGPICLIRCLLSRLSAINLGSSLLESSVASPLVTTSPIPPTPFSLMSVLLMTAGGGTSLAESLFSNSISPLLI